MDRETAVARKQVDDADTAIKQEQKDMRNAEKAGLTTTKPERPFEEMLNAIRECLRDLASSNNGEDGEDEEDDQEDPELGKLKADDEPWWVMGTISNKVQHSMDRVQQKQRKHDRLMQPGWEAVADLFHERGKMYGTTELKVQAVVQPQTEDDAASSPPMTFGERMQNLDSIPGKLLMRQVTSRPGSCCKRLVSQNPEMHKCIPSFPPNTKRDLVMITESKRVESVSFYPFI